jgi:hypothetical protein
MNVRRTSTTLWTTAVLLAIAAVVALVVGWVAPLDTGETGSNSSASGGTTDPLAAGMRRLPTPDAFTSAAGINWRTGQPIAPPAPPPVEPVVPDAPVAVEAASAMPAITLDGTLGRTLAIVRTASGATEVKRAGEIVDGVEIVEVGAGQIRVKFNGEEKTIEKPKPADNVMIGG